MFPDDIFHSEQLIRFIFPKITSNKKLSIRLVSRLIWNVSDYDNARDVETDVNISLQIVSQMINTGYHYHNAFATNHSFTKKRRLIANSYYLTEYINHTNCEQGIDEHEYISVLSNHDKDHSFLTIVLKNLERC